MVYKDQSTLIFNDLQDDICEEDNDNRPTIPTTYNEISKWNNKENKEYVTIVETSEEVRRYIISIKDSYRALNKLKDLYDWHS